MSVGFFLLLFWSVSARIQQTIARIFAGCVQFLLSPQVEIQLNLITRTFFFCTVLVCCSAYALRPQEKKYSICEWNSRNQLNSIFAVCLRAVCWMANDYYHKLSAEHQFTFYTFRRAYRLRRRFGEHKEEEGEKAK